LRSEKFFRIFYNRVSTNQTPLQMRTFTHFGAKNFEFLEIYGVSTRTEEIDWTQTFCGQGACGGRVNFSRFCANVFMDGPLSRI